MFRNYSTASKFAEHSMQGNGLLELRSNSLVHRYNRSEEFVTFIFRMDSNPPRQANKVRGLSYPTPLPVHQTASRSLYAGLNKKCVDHRNQPAFIRLYGEIGHVASRVRKFLCLYLMKHPKSSREIMYNRHTCTFCTQHFYMPKTGYTAKL